MRLNDIGGKLSEGYRVVPGFDKDKYQERQGLEGPFSTKSGKVVYYDKVEGKYYDPDTDMYIEYDDWQAMNDQGVAEGWKEKVAAGLTAAAMATGAGGVVLNPARPIGPKGQTVANPYPNKATNTKSAEDDAWAKIEKRRAVEKKGVAEGSGFDKWADERVASQLHKLKKPHPETWHDVDKKLGKAVDKMSQAEKVKKGFAHPDTLKKKGVAEGSASVDFKGRPVDQELVKKQGKYWDQAAKEKKQQELKRSKQLRQQGVAEGSEHISSMIQQYEDMVELVYDLPPGRKKNIAIDKRDALEAQIEAMPGGKEALRKWAKSYNDAMDEGVAEGSSDRRKQEQEADKWLEKRIMKCTCPTSARNNPKCPVHGKKKGVAEGAFDNYSPMAKDTIKQDKIRSLENLIAIYKKEGRQLRVQELERELSSLKNVSEGPFHNPGQEDSPVAQAITRRILLQRTDLLAKYGPEKVGQAIDEVADFVGDVDEIGSSDVSGWIRHVEQMLGNMGESQFESEGAPKSALGKALWRDLSKFKKASPAQQQRNKERWAQRQAEKNKEVDEGYDKWGWHTSLTNGEFMPTKYGNKDYVYLHDLDNESPRGGPQLVTVNKPTVAKRIARQFGAKVVKTDLNTYRIVKPAEQGVAEGVDTSNLTNIAQATGKLKGREAFVWVGDPRIPLSNRVQFKRGIIDDREQNYGIQPGTGSRYTYWLKDEDGKDFRAPERDVFVSKQGVAEGAKVDRMVKHIAKSEREAGKSAEEAGDIAWATANKRGYLDNKNKKAK